MNICGYDVDHPLAYSVPDAGCGILLGVRRLVVSLEDGTSVSVSGSDFEEWARLYRSLGRNATAQWTGHEIVSTASGTDAAGSGAAPAPTGTGTQPTSSATPTH